MPLKSTKQIQLLKMQQRLIVANEEERKEREENAKAALRVLKLTAKENLADFAEIVFDFDNGEHHHEWYDIPMNKLRTPDGGDWNTPLVQARVS